MGRPTYWRREPRSPLHLLQNEFQRMLAEYLTPRPGDPETPPAGGDRPSWSPPVDVYETPEEMIVVAEIPGVDPASIELALTGNYEAAHIAIAYTYQQCVQLATWSRDVEDYIGWPVQFRKWLDNMTDEDRTALKEYRHVRIDRRDVVEALRSELALYVPRGSRYRRVMRRRIRVERYGLN